ncbi:hypothetical protein HOE07_02735 [archaeon]|jgi:hypothetical protein|nr:hypothetical protein [archaeon]
MFFKRDTKRKRIVRKILTSSVSKVEKEEEEKRENYFKKTIELVENLLNKLKVLEKERIIASNLKHSRFSNHPKVNTFETTINSFWEGFEEKLQIIENSLGEEYSEGIDIFSNYTYFIRRIHDSLLDLKKTKNLGRIIETLEEIKKRLSIEKNLLRVTHIGAQQLLGNSFIKQTKEEIAKYLVEIIKKKYSGTWKFDVSFSSKKEKIYMASIAEYESEQKEGSNIKNFGAADLVELIGTPKILRETQIIEIFPNKENTSVQPINIFVEYVVSKDEFVFSSKLKGSQGNPQEIGKYPNIFDFASDKMFIQKLQKLAL